MRTLKTFGKALGAFIGILVIVLLVYVLYIMLQYSRINDNLDISDDITRKPTSTAVEVGTSYSVTTYNIGFGAYNREYSFFMDKGIMKDGTETVGKSGKAKDKETVLENTNGAISIIQELDSDFLFFQEVDVEATRSYQVNQLEMLNNTFNNFDSIIGINFHSAYLAYPLLDNHGKTISGIVTMSKYKISSTIRYQLPVDDSFPTKFFDLDRCFTVTRVDVKNSDKELVLINVHLSAYDEGGKIRALQVEKLMQILEEEKGNYVIVGGDFNHDIADSVNLFESEQLQPEWLQIFDKSALISGYSFATATNGPTCRGSDIAYEKGVTYSVVIDGFIVSQNITVEMVENIVTDSSNNDITFMYSDHNPVKMNFILNNE